MGRADGRAYTQVGFERASPNPTEKSHTSHSSAYSPNQTHDHAVTSSLDQPVTAAGSANVATRTALIVCIRFSASSKTIECADSKTSSVTSSSLRP